MLLSIDDMVSLLRSSVNVQKEDDTTDPAYLVMTDDDIKLFIKLGVSRAFPEVSDLTFLEDGSEYPIILLAKIELYLKLAVIKADKIDMGADGAYLKQDQRFQHYMALAEETRAEYDSYLENEGQGKVSSYDVLLSSRHYSRRNYENQPTPRIIVSLDLVTSEDVYFSYKLYNSSHFGRFKAYISTKKPIVNVYKEGRVCSDFVDEDATLVLSTGDIRKTHHQVSGLSPNTLYYLVVFAIERNQVFGYYETSFTTLEELVEENDVSKTTID